MISVISFSVLFYKSAIVHDFKSSQTNKFYLVIIYAYIKYRVDIMHKYEKVRLKIKYRKVFSL